MKALKGEGQEASPHRPPALPVKTAQDELRELDEREAAQRCEQAEQQGHQQAQAAAEAVMAAQGEAEPHNGAVEGAGQDREAVGGGEGGDEGGVDPTAAMSGRQKKLYELQQRMRQVRHAC